MNQGIAAIAICNGAYAPTAEYIFDNLLYIANKLKDEEMCKKIKKLRIEKQIKLGDAAMIEEITIMQQFSMKGLLAMVIITACIVV